jgi:hypothetical protein
MHSLALKFPGFGWWWILLLIGSIGLIIFSFRKIAGAKNPLLIRILLILRSLVLVLLLILILRPEIHWTSSRHKAPSALIWIDNSCSIAEQSGFSADSLLAKIQVIREALTAKNIKPRLFLFDEKVKPITGKLRKIEYDGQVTDLAQVLNYSKTEFENENIAGAILISDGVITRGEDLTFREFKLPFPIFAIGIGDSNRILDPAVTKIEMPQTVSAGDTVVINTELIPSGNGEPIAALLKEGSNIIQKKIIQSQIQGLKKNITFQFIPDEPGEKVLTVEIVAAQDKNPYNNLRMSTLKVLAAQTKILIISGQSNFEARFMAETLRELKNVQVQNVAEISGQWLPLSFSEIIAEKWDLLVLIGYPITKSEQKDIFSLQRKIIDSGLPVILFLNRNIDIQQVERLLGWNPISELAVEQSISQINVIPTRAGLEHPIIRNFQKDNLSETTWSVLPPIGSPFKKIRLATSFQSLIESHDLAQNPVIAVNQEMKRPMAVCAGLDFWRWSFMTQETGRINVYDELFQAMAQWLTDTLNSSPVQVTINKKIFLSGETLDIAALVYDLKGHVISNASVQTELLQQNDVMASGNLTWDGKNYSGSMPVMKAGEFQLRLAAWQNDKSLGMQEQNITVIDRPIELIEIRQNVDLLRTIANRSGGIKTDRIPDIIERLKVNDKIIHRSHQVNFLRWKWALIVLIGLLAIEWSIRRFQGYQ